jgi:hypothetical protein
MNYVDRRKDRLIENNLLQNPLKLDRLKVAFNFQQNIKRGRRKTVLFSWSAVLSIKNIMDGTLNSGTMDSNQLRKFVLKS